MRLNLGGTKKDPYAEPVEARTALNQVYLDRCRAVKRDGPPGRGMKDGGEMERVINLHIEKLPEGVYLGTSDELPGLVAPRRRSKPRRFLTPEPDS